MQSLMLVNEKESTANAWGRVADSKADHTRSAAGSGSSVDQSKFSISPFQRHARQIGLGTRAFPKLASNGSFFVGLVSCNSNSQSS